MRKIVTQETLDPDSKEDLREGLEIIRTRADSLSRFMEDYSRLAKLPAPNRQPTSLGRLVEHAARLSKEVPVDLLPGPEIVLPIDSDQVEQLLINVIKNAVEATLETGGRVRVTWGIEGTDAKVTIEDEGNGIANPANLFIPFFSTKSGGSGIGLTLSRQIADNHDGHLELVNRQDRSGCRATLTLPLDPI
jgi:signal transduction histidine kinase